MKKWVIRIHVLTHCDAYIMSYFDGLSYRNFKNGEAIIKGFTQDLSKVYGMIIATRDLGIPLKSIYIKSV